VDQMPTAFETAFETGGSRCKSDIDLEILILSAWREILRPRFREAIAIQKTKKKK